MDVPRESPHVSVNKLGRYLTATPALRKRLIDNQKHPPDPQYLRYPEASQAITDFLCRGQDEALLRQHQHRLATTVFAHGFDAHRAQLCIEAIEYYRQLHPRLGLHDVVASEVGHEPPALEIAGVSIRVWPQMVLQTVDRHGNNKVGVMKLYFSKHHPLDERSGQYIATLLQAFTEQHLSLLGPVDPKLVRVVDVFAGREYQPPRARTRRLCDVQRACEEIAARWPVQ
ncbi:hypothetical protein JQX13_16550 [Archangium violaceum]|uniref:hypothetical protein n=1 Tax=Archangium violaceum TaxID=83451 RepID=UPI00193BE587|nr:hypothetical protein [Archangium violaceum]QRK11535.1 hypothetical protein JQX13_16550 [Archangium violaceum]